MDADLITVRDLRVSFSGNAGLAKVLDGLSCAIRPGEIRGLVGESGCGKTTLARAILGILPPTSARIEGGQVWWLLGEDRVVSTESPLEQGHP